MPKLSVTESAFHIAFFTGNDAVVYYYAEGFHAGDVETGEVFVLDTPLLFTPFLPVFRCNWVLRNALSFSFGCSG